MKETKVYADALPKDCKDCPCCSCELKPEFIKFGDIMYCNLLKQKFKYKEERKKLKDCPLIDIKTHDRELVKEVLEKVKNEAYKEGFVDEYGDRVVSYHIYNFLLDKIQKEYEK